MMRKSICVVLAVALLTGSFLLCRTAAANSWGLKGKLLTAVMADHTWDDYSILSNQEDPFAVMKSRYELTLLFDNGGAIVRGLELTEEGFSLLFWEGGGGYISYDESQDPEADHG